MTPAAASELHKIWVMSEVDDRTGASAGCAEADGEVREWLREATDHQLAGLAAVGRHVVARSRGQPGGCVLHFSRAGATIRTTARFGQRVRVANGVLSRGQTNLPGPASVTMGPALAGCAAPRPPPSHFLAGATPARPQEPDLLLTCADASSARYAVLRTGHQLVRGWQTRCTWCVWWRRRDHNALPTRLYTPLSLHSVGKNVTRAAQRPASR